MTELTIGKYYGHEKHKKVFNDVIISDRVYCHQKEDPWHYHQNPYFTFIIYGNMIEERKNGSVACSSNTLLFHNNQEPHCNIYKSGFVQGLQVELEDSWFKNYFIEKKIHEGSQEIKNPALKKLFQKIYQEAYTNDCSSKISIQTLLMQCLPGLATERYKRSIKPPKWTDKLVELFNDRFNEPLHLADIAVELDVHPVTISKEFPRYFNSNFGEYLRKIRIERSIHLILTSGSSFADVAYSCGFADQSHFVRTFKNYTGLTPLKFKKSIRNMTNKSLTR